jgi:hypothetical protein
MFERHDQKLIIFAFMAVFMIYCPQFCGSGVIYKAHDTQGLFVWAVCGWLCRGSCCAEKAAVQRKLLF